MNRDQQTELANQRILRLLPVCGGKGNMTKKIRSSEIGRFDVSPENQGQIVTVSYAWADGVIIERVYDASDRTESMTAYEDGDQDGEWDPWNRTPKLGKALGSVEIIEDED